MKSKFSSNGTMKVEIINLPELIFVLIWLFAFLLFEMAFGNASLSVLLFVLVFSYFFLFGAVAGTKFKVLVRMPVTRSFVALVVFCSVFATVTVVYCAIVVKYLAAASSIAIGIVEIRQSSISGDSVIGFTSLFTNSIQFLFALSVYGFILSANHKNGNASTFMLSRQRNINYGKLFATFVGISLVASILDGSRSFFVNGLLVWLIVLLKLKVVNYKRLINIIIVFFILFSLSFSFFRPEVSDFFAGFTYTVLYFSGGIGALDFVLNGEAIVYWQDFESIANKLGGLGFPVGGYDLQSLMMDHVTVSDGYSTNVFTALGVYYSYMGYWSVIFGSFIGFIVRYSCWLSNKSSLGLLGYSFILSSLVISVFHDYLLQNIYILLKIIFILFIIEVARRLAVSLLKLARGLHRESVCAAS